MKSKFLLCLVALLPLVSYGQANKVRIAIVDHSALIKAVSFDVLYELERGETHRRSIKDLRVKLEEIQSRLLKASDEEELKKAQAEVTFLNQKINAVRSMSYQRRSGTTERDELYSLVKEQFSKEYSIILLVGNEFSSNPLPNAVLANVEYVDITPAVAALVKKEMGEK